MRLAHRFLLTAALLVVLSLALLVEPAGSQSLFEDGVRTIQLSPTGKDRANTLVFSPDGTQIAVGTTSGVRFFDVSSLTPAASIDTGTWVRSLDISADGGLMAGGLFDNSARIWSLPSMQTRAGFKDLGGFIRSVAFSADGLLMAAAGGDSLRVWNVMDGSLKYELPDLQGIRALAISPDGNMIALGLKDKTIQLRALQDGALIRKLTGHKDWVRALAFSPDGSQLASGAFDATARLWDTATGQLQFTLEDHSSSVLGIDYSPDGTILATGSVDRTVRLWDPRTGTLTRTLVGHNGFVYSVAFSPDGKLLASGGEDNSVRLWDLASAPDGAALAPATPSDCRVCHHPIDNFNSVAVVDVRCDACHQNGLALNWCPDFPRSVNENYKMEIRSFSVEKAGLAIPGDTLAVTIFSPANGERIYSNTEYVAPLQVRGRVENSAVQTENIEVHLEAWAGDELVASLIQKPQPNGIFIFSIGVNSHGNRLRITSPSVPLSAPLSCSTCHDDYIPQAILPGGEILLRVTAVTTTGERAEDARWITVDVNNTLPLLVNVKDSATGRPVVGVFVQATTLLYEWRERNETAISGKDGAASLLLEVLSQAVTSYRITIPDQVVNGISYSEFKGGTIMVEPGSASAPALTVEVRSQVGKVTGSLMDAPAGVIPVWAVHLPAGPWFTVQTDASGGFTFDILPVGEYKVFADPASLAEVGYTAQTQELDLRGSPEQVATLNAVPAGTSMTGTINGALGEWLPFAWMTAPDGSSVRVESKSSQWMLNTASDDGEWVAGSPGYYSLKSRSSEGALNLNPRPDLQKVAWGEGEISLPVGTQAEAGQGSITFDSGWLWGSNPAGSEFRIHSGATEILLTSGRFALERPVSGIAWLYMFEGDAKLRIGNNSEPVIVHAGEMASLVSGAPQPAPYTPEVITALLPEEWLTQEPAWEPGLAERIQAATGQTGVLLAQLVTFITYFIALISLVVIPLLMLRWFRRRTSGDKVHGKH